MFFVSALASHEMRRFATVKLLDSFLFYWLEKACSMKSHDSLTAVRQIVLKLSSMTANSF